MEKVYKYLYEDMVKELSNNEVKQLYVKAVEQTRKITEMEVNFMAGSYNQSTVDKIVSIKNILKRELKRRKLIK